MLHGKAPATVLMRSAVVVVVLCSSPLAALEEVAVLVPEETPGQPGAAFRVAMDGDYIVAGSGIGRPEAEA